MHHTTNQRISISSSLQVSGGPDGEDKYLIATSEQPICGYHAGEWLEEKTLPLRYRW